MKLQQQQASFEAIKTLCVNYKKDATTRKTQDYLNKRLSSLDASWAEFESLHLVLEKEIEDKNINYFSEDIYGKTKAMYETTKSDIMRRLNLLTEEITSVKFDLTGFFNGDNDNDVISLLNRQECNFRAIDRAMSKIDIATTSNEKWELEDNLNILKSKWSDIDKLHWEIDGILKGSHETYYSTFVDIECKHDRLRKELNSKIWSTAHYQKSAPRIEIPQFSGNYNQWISFKDLFIETVHNNPTINNAQKMQHLKTKLRGEAERLVQHLTINADNYKSCWDILKQRYDNRRLQFISFMNTMMHLPVIQQPDSYNIKKMHDVITECLSGLSNIGLDTSTWDPVIVYLMTQKLDTATHNDYVRELQDHRDVPALCDFLYFLESKFMAFETMKRTKKDPINQQKPVITKSVNKEYPTKKPYFNNFKPNSNIHHAAYGQCPLCDETHVLMQCQKFIDLDIPQRNVTVAKLQVCKNCLFSHGGMECKSNKTCKECNLKHHSLLHNNYMKKQLSTGFKKYNYDPKPSTSTQASNHHLAAKDMEVLLTTVQLQLQSFDGTWVKLRALLDQGSQVNLITENAAQLLKLPRNKLNATVSGIGDLSGNCKGKTQLTCKSLHSDYVFKTEALILNKLTNNLPNATFKKNNWPHLENLKLADADFNVSRPVDLLLGADVYADIIMDGVLKGDQQAPIAQQTHLGWILCGKLITFNCHVTLINMNELTKFWENEDITQNNEDIPINDECEEYYKRTVQRGPDGKYIVKMPLTPNFEKKLGNSKQIAVSQFLQLEKRLQRKTNLANMYKEFIKEYSDLKHMKPSTSTSARDCFLPHHGVLRDNATTTKLRVVFNASQKTSSGYSLNSLQEKGPNLQTDIQALILRWRSYKYAFTADVEKMYRCIWISADQQQLQKIVWRNSPSEMLQEYQLCTVTYGTKSAPWLAIRTLKQLAIDDGHKYPAAAETLKNEFYVDDLVSGHNSMEEAKQLQQSLINLLQGGGMNLRKWSTNHPTLTEHLTEDQISKGKTFDFKHEDFMKTLGLSWNPNTDTFMCNWDLDKNTKYPVTKRILLSEISRLYDPLGWYSAVTVTAKLLFQRVWISKLSWDEVLPSDIQQEWLKLKAELPLISNIQLNRWIGGTTKQIELLGFCDASEKAFACVIYTRIKDEHGKPRTTLLTAKTRVAPLSQKTTLPKLELCGALLLSQLMKKVIDAYKAYEINIKAWCDSQVVLAWLQGNVTRWEKYVANRVTKIKEIIPSEKWHYIKSEKNPADCATRGMYPSKLIHFNLWWHGPLLQETDEKQEPANMTFHLTTNIGTITQEEATLASKHNDDFINKLLEKYSSLTRVIRVTAWILRATAKRRGKQKHDTDYLLTSELLEAGELVTRHAQRSAFPIEYKLLSRNKLITKNSPIYKLQPYLDEKGIIRVGGRLNYSNLPPGMKNPILLPRKGRMTHLVINHGHLSTLHGGARLALNFIRQRYWILGGNRAVKNQLQNCIRCLRFKQSVHHQLMADLPRQRITPSRPFTNTGVDFTGNVEVKINKGRGVKTSKGYIVVFVCLVTKAVHIELTSDMSAETFLAAFERFCARRGTPKHVYSDCGTNFVGASRDLRNQFEEFKQMLNKSSFFDEIGKLEVEWHFNAPAWPSGGGIWESAVKSLKYHLRRVLGEQKLTFEEFTTLLNKIEACLNSRPLCALTEDPDEYYNCLTPGHFLTGSPTMSLPHTDHSDIRNIDLRQRWQLTEHMTQRFWKSWSSDYLSQLQRRSKWNKPTKNIKVDDIVLVKEDNLPPGKWAMGRVIDVHPGADGYVRVTTIKTKTGILKRPVVKLAPLPLDTTNEKYEEKQPQQGLQNNQKKTSRVAQRKNTNKQCLLTLFTSLIMMCALTASSQAAHVPSSARITPLEPERPVYYDTMGKIQVIHDKWTLLLYYNLTNYWEGTNRMATYLNGVSNWCQKIDPKYCNTTLNQLYHEMEQLQYYNTILLAPHKHLSDRRKRGLIDGVGYLTNDLFGILDQRFAEKYKSDIKAVQNNEKYLLELIKNQTSVVELENKILKKSEANIKRQFDVIENFMNQTNSNFAKIESTVMTISYFNSAAFSAYLLLNNLKNVQEMLFNSLTDVYKGRMDIHLVTPVNLIEQMNIIAGKLPRTLSLPVDNIREDIKNLYKLLYVKARVTDSLFLFEVHIPLISDEDFTLQRAIPLPMKTNRGTVNVQTSSRYIAVNFHKNTYISLKEEDLKQCVQLKLDNFICNKNLPVFNLHNDNIPCEAKLIGHRTTTPCDVTSTSCNDAWIELHSPNAWLAICCDTCTLRVICEDDITSHTMTSSGIITLPQSCVLQSKYLTIHSLSQYNSKVKVDYDINVPTLTSSINQIANITFHSAPQLFLTKGLDKDTERIDKTLIDLKKNEEGLPSEMTSHDVHRPRGTSVKGARVHRRSSVVGAESGAGGAGAGGEQRAHFSKIHSPHSPRDAAREIRRGARALRDARDRLHQLHEKAVAGEWGAGEAREASARAAQLLREVERLQRIVADVPRREAADAPPPVVYHYEPALAHEMRMPHPSVVLAPPCALAGPGALRSKSEMELSRRLSESLDMQERLAADNAALDGKRYVLYKELMCKEQRLETARAQAARLRAELKLLARDNARLTQAVARAQLPSPAASDTEQRLECDSEAGGDPSPIHADLEKQLCELEAEVLGLKEERELLKMKEGTCKGGGGRNTCFEQPLGMPPMPPLQKICGVCPPCPAPCNPEAPPTPAEREAAKLALQLKQTEESFKGKVAECAMLRAEVLRRKDEADRERCLAREAQARLRELEIKFEGLNMQTNAQLGTREQAFENEVSVRALKQCYREAREEVEELRGLLTEQGIQLQDYRIKYLQTQQLAEEQKRQMTTLDMDNTRISEQINLEIQRVKIKFQEKLQELAPVPELLKATQRRLQDAQQAQALAEHNAEQLARELNCAREKVHVLMHSTAKVAAEKGADRSGDEKLLNAAQARIAQLTESNKTLKGEIDKLKMNVIRMEEKVLASDKRLREKMEECGVLGAELDRARDDASRAICRANARADTVRKCMQTSVAELEKQLAVSRAQVGTAEQEREELQEHMRCQIKRLQENFEQAQNRVLGLQTEVFRLRRKASEAGDSEEVQDPKVCACRYFFQE